MEKIKCNCVGLTDLGFPIEMEEVGGIGKYTEILGVFNNKAGVIGKREMKLYQCPNCKRIIIN